MVCSFTTCYLDKIEHPGTVLTADYAALLAEEFGRNPIISDEAAFDIHPLFVASFLFTVSD